MRSLGYGLLLASLALFGMLASTDAIAANTSGPPKTTGAPTPTGGGGSGTNPLINPHPSVWYPFNGDLKDPLGGTPTMTEDQRNGLVFKYDTGKDGSAKGAITGLAIMPFLPSYFYPAEFTMVFSVYVAEAHSTDCSIVPIFVDGYLANETFRTDSLTNQWNSVSLKICMVAATPGALNDFVEARFQTQKSPTEVTTTTSTANVPMAVPSAWHEIKVVFSLQRKQMGVFVDGAGVKAPVTGPILGNPTQKAQRQIQLGGPTDIHANWEYGKLDDFKLYPVALWPGEGPTVQIPKAGLGAAAIH